MKLKLCFFGWEGSFFEKWGLPLLVIIKCPYFIGCAFLEGVVILLMSHKNFSLSKGIQGVSHEIFRLINHSERRGFALTRSNQELFKDLSTKLSEEAQKKELIGRTVMSKAY